MFESGWPELLVFYFWMCAVSGASHSLCLFASWASFPRPSCSCSASASSSGCPGSSLGPPLGGRGLCWLAARACPRAGYVAPGADLVQGGLRGVAGDGLRVFLRVGAGGPVPVVEPRRRETPGLAAVGTSLAAASGGQRGRAAVSPGGGARRPRGTGVVRDPAAGISWVVPPPRCFLRPE